MSVQNTMVDFAKDKWKPISAFAVVGALGSLTVTLISKTGLLASAHCLNPLVGAALFAICGTITCISSDFFNNKNHSHLVAGILLTYGPMKLLNSI